MRTFVNYNPEFTQLVDQVGSSESDFYKFLLPVNLCFILEVILNTITVPALLKQLLLLNVWLLNQLYNFRILIDYVPYNHLFFYVDSYCKVHQICHKFLPNVFGIDLKAYERQVLADPKWQQVKNEVKVQTLPHVGQSCKLEGNLHNQNE